MSLKKLDIALVFMLVMMVCMKAGMWEFSAEGASHGIYTATATSHYKHPNTGIIEDSGGENAAVLGQSMTDSALNSQALVEVDEKGDTYATIRLNLMDNIKNPQFQVDGNKVSSSVMQEDYTENTTDFRMKLVSENSIIRCNMYVTPMGREVIFYITLSNLQSGSGDFITSIQTKSTVSQSIPSAKNANQGIPAQDTNVRSEEVQNMQDEHNPDTQNISRESVNQDNSERNQEVETDSAQNSFQKSEDNQNVILTDEQQSSRKTEEENREDSATTVSNPDSKENKKVDESKEETVAGLVEYNKDGNRVTVQKQAVKKSNRTWSVIAVIVILLAGGGCGWFFYKKKRNEVSL